MELDIGKPIMEKNDTIAQENRKLLDEKQVFVINLMASPGSGKTSTILATISALSEKYKFAVIEGDIASQVDSLKIKETGVPCVQINTGGICHLESNMIKKALEPLDLDNIDVLFVENVGNLVCTTDFDLGENVKVVILSVPEGDDKPVKYPNIFQVADAVLLNKVDTMCVFDFDQDAFEKSLDDLNPLAPMFKISATKGEGVDDWASWLDSEIESFRGRN